MEASCEHAKIQCAEHDNPEAFMSRHLHNIYCILIVYLFLLLTGCGGSSGSDVSTATNARSIYIDAALGNDVTGDGSISLPYRSFARLSSLIYSGNTTIYLKRGDIWHEPLIIPASNITVDAYGSGALPIIDCSRQVGNWTNLGNGLYTTHVILNSSEALGNLSENGVMMTFVAWNTNAITTFTSAGTGSFSYDYATSTLYIKPASIPGNNSYMASVQLRGVYANKLTDIAIRHLQVQRVSLHGIEFDNCVRCSVANVTVINSGGAVIGSNVSSAPDYLYAGNGIDYSNNSSYGSVNNVTVSGIFDSCLAIEAYEANSTASSIDLGNAQLARCGFAGIEVSVQSNQSTNTNSLIDGVSLHDIQIDSAGKGWSGRRYGTTGHGIRIVADQNAGSMKNLSIVRTTVTNSAGDGIKLAGKLNLVSLHRIQSAQNAGAGINIADATTTSLAIKLSSSLLDNNTGYGLSYNAPQAAGLQIYHTDFIDNGSINLAIFAQSNLADIRNNLFYASSPMTDLYSAAALVNPTVDNNCYNDTTNMFGYNGTTYSTVTGFQSATGLESNGMGSGNVGLSNPSISDFTLQANSSCIGLGDNTDGVTEDYTGKTYASPPASGAYAAN